MTDYFGEKMEATGTRLLWGTANLFTHRRFMAGAATNPDPDVFAYRRRDGEILHRRDPPARRRELRAVGRARGLRDAAEHRPQARTPSRRALPAMVVEYKHKIGFKGTILIEPKPQEPTKHQYDYDVATVYGFLKRFGLENEVKVNIEQGHAILAGHIPSSTSWRWPRRSASSARST
jgi:xylose isomerase